jgi:hypothetical protein
MNDTERPMGMAVESKHPHQGLSRGRAQLGAMLLVALFTPATLASGNVNPADLFSMMQGMAGAMRTWEALSGSGAAGGTPGPGTAFGSMPSAGSWPGMSGIMPGQSPGGSLPGMGGAPWSGAMPGAGWPSGMVPPVPPALPGMPGMFQGMPGMPQSSGARQSPLDGVWQGESGDLVTFRDGQFRLEAAGQVAEGPFMVHENRMIAYLPQADTTRKFLYEIRGEWLVLLDESGQGLLFRRSR